MKTWATVAAAVAVLLGTWGLAVSVGVTAGGAIHLLPVVALGLLATRLMRRAPPKGKGGSSYARWLASKGAGP